MSKILEMTGKGLAASLLIGGLAPLNAADASLESVKAQIDALKSNNDRLEKDLARLQGRLGDLSGQSATVWAQVERDIVPAIQRAWALLETKADISEFLSQRDIFWGKSEDFDTITRVADEELKSKGEIFRQMRSIISDVENDISTMPNQAVTAEWRQAIDNYLLDDERFETTSADVEWD